MLSTSGMCSTVSKRVEVVVAGAVVTAAEVTGGEGGRLLMVVAGGGRPVRGGVLSDGSLDGLL